MKRLLALAITLLTSLTAVAEQKTVNIVTVNNPDMITLKKPASKFEEANRSRLNFRYPNSETKWRFFSFL